MASIWEELKRRKVVKVTLAYVIAGWLLAQVAEFATATFGAPDWVLKIFVVFLGLGLPLAIILAWAYEMTPAGLKKTDAADTARPARSSLNFAFVAVLVVVATAAAWLQFSDFEPRRKAAGTDEQRLELHSDELGVSYHFDIAFPGDAPLALIGPAALANGRQAFAISPDGSKLVYVADLGGKYQLFLRELDSHDARPIPGTKNAYGPFFSPNGAWVGYFVDNELRKVRLNGGNSLLVANATNSTGAVWLKNDDIIMATNEGAELVRVPARGGSIEVLLENVSNVAFPHSLTRDADVLLVRAWAEGIGVSVFNIDAQEEKRLPINGGEARFANGFLFYLDGSSVYAARFDAQTRTLGSAPIPVLTGVKSEIYGAGQWSVSESGTLLYVPGRTASSSPLHWVTPETSEAIDLPIRDKGTFEISPDGKRFAVIEFSAGAADVWLYDFAKYQPRKLTVDGRNRSAIFWMPDGSSLVYHKWVDGNLIPFRQYLDAGSSGEPLLPPEYKNLKVASVSRDGRYFGVTEPDRLSVIDVNDLTQTTIPTIGDVNWGTAISPDGGAVVYTSAESGAYQNYLQPLPTTGKRYQISRVGGAEEPRWSPDGSKVYYRSGQRIMIVDVEMTPDVKIGEPEVYFSGEFENVGHRSYDIHTDGKRALVIRSDNTTTSIRVVTNWFNEVERRIRENEASSP